MLADCNSACPYGRRITNTLIYIHVHVDKAELNNYKAPKAADPI